METWALDGFFAMGDCGR